MQNVPGPIILLGYVIISATAVGLIARMLKADIAVIYLLLAVAAIDFFFVVGYLAERDDKRTSKSITSRAASNGYWLFSNMVISAALHVKAREKMIVLHRVLLT